MSKTVRALPKRKGYSIFLRKPGYKWKLLAGISSKKVVTDNDEKIVAATREMRLDKCKSTGAVKQARSKSRL